MREDDFRELVTKYLSGTTSPAEKRLLEEYYSRLAVGADPLGAEEEERLRLDMLAAIFKKAGIPQAPVITRKPVRWWRYAAAACGILLLGSGAYFFFFNKAKVEVARTPIVHFKNDVPPPTGTRAVLTLASGKRVILDSTAVGALTQQGDASVRKMSAGQLAYHTTTEKPAPVVYNTLSTGKGGQTSVLLADGTQVWLNSASSLTYPTSFVGKDRIVSLQGEAYFEVAKNTAMPFRVNINDMTVDVLGTHFNVNAYDDEALVKTTLLEGSVKISKENAAVLLKPGQQAQVDGTGAINLIANADLDQAVAWKNGYFQFKRDELQQVLRQLTRWYDIEVKYEGVIPNMQFGGRISRDNNLSQVLKILELSKVHFRIEGKTLVVMP